VRALHQVVTASAGGRRAVPVFTGSRVPVRKLVEHLDNGGDLESFLARYSALSRDTVLAALALGLEALTREVPREPPPTQHSLLPRLDSGGAITNPDELRADQIIGRKVLCPSCRRLVFKSWPEGWDGHAAGPCRGLSKGDARSRKHEFKTRFGHLFRK